MGLSGTWNGVDREKVPWYPTVDGAKCSGCRACVEFCSHDVYSWDDANSVPVVAEPFHCVVGCSNCSHQCPQEAIQFPPLTVLRGIGAAS
jgi:NAD-dependent dihydropyrimidine dehydrogenase PreA subunit